MQGRQPNTHNLRVGYSLSLLLRACRPSACTWWTVLVATAVLQRRTVLQRRVVAKNKQNLEERTFLHRCRASLLVPTTRRCLDIGYDFDLFNFNKAPECQLLVVVEEGERARQHWPICLHALMNAFQEGLGAASIIPYSISVKQPLTRNATTPSSLDGCSSYVLILHVDLPVVRPRSQDYM